MRCKELMRSIYFSTLLWLCLITTAFAECAGTDLRPTLTQTQRAELDNRLQQIPYPSGIHWRAVKGAQVIDLIGTVHISDPRLDPITAALKPIIESADLLLVEATEAEETKLKQAVGTTPELLFLTEGPTLPELLSEETWQTLSAAAMDRGIPAFMAAKFQPWYLSMMLTLPACAMKELQSQSHGLDKRLMQVASSAGVRQEALEPFDTMFKLFGQEPLEDQIRYLELGLIPNRAAEDAIATLMAGYFDEETAEIMELSRIITRPHFDMSDDDFDRLMDDMLDLAIDQRNRRWMAKILTAAETRIVVAAGAAHLPGEAGLLNLLAQEGFTLERQQLP